MGLGGGGGVNVYGGGSSDVECVYGGRSKRIKKVQLYNGRTGA